MWKVRCWVLDVECWVLDVEWAMWHGNVLPQIAARHRNHAGCFIKKHRFHRCARMGLFTDCLLLLRCLPLGFDAPSAQRIATDFFASGELCGRMSHDGLAWYAKNLWKSARSVGDK